MSAEVAGALLGVAGAAGLAVVVLRRLEAACPCGGTHAPRAEHARAAVTGTHASTHGAHTVVTASREPAGQTIGRGLTHR